MKILLAWSDQRLGEIIDITSATCRNFDIRCQVKNFQKVFEADLPVEDIKVWGDYLKGYCFETQVKVMLQDNRMGDIMDSNNYKYLKTSTYVDRLEKFIWYDSLDDTLYLKKPQKAYITSCYRELSEAVKYDCVLIPLTKKEVAYRVIEHSIKSN